MNRQNIITMIVLFLMVLVAAPAANAIMIKLTSNQLVQRAGTIVRGTVTEKIARPGASADQIETRIVVWVDQVLKGDAAQQIEIIIPGGVLDYGFMFRSDFPNFEAGQQVVLYLRDDATRLVGQIQGKFTIEQGAIKETGLDATDYLTSVQNLVAGFSPIIELDVPFIPVSVEQGIIEHYSSKFLYEGLSWNTHTVGLYINENSSDTSGEGQAVKNAMNAWTYAPANFSFTYNGSHNRTSVYSNYKNELMWGWDNYIEAIAYAVCWGDNSEIIECDMLFKNDYTWSAVGNPSYDEMDVQSIATHELGHFLQLLDLYNSSDSGKTMFGYGSPGETYARTLHQDDINGIVHIYGSGPGDDDDDTPTDDDDTPSDDDDTPGDDDDNTDPGNAHNCGDMLNLIYNDCNMEIHKMGSSFDGQAALNMCKDDDGPWDCIFECANHDNVDSCSSLTSCLDSQCNVTLEKTYEDAVSDSDDNDDGSSCGLF